jgi:hypothetical protein
MCTQSCTNTDINDAISKQGHTCYLECESSCDQEILRFDVPVQHVIVMQVLQSAHQVLEIFLQTDRQTDRSTASRPLACVHSITERQRMHMNKSSRPL